jgi:predicted nucleic acid-binding protein
VIVVDTSVWIAAQRQAFVAKVLEQLIEADEVAIALPVRLELWAGVAKHDRKAHRAAFSALPQVVPTEETWQPLTDWIARAADAGERFTISDLLIASLAVEIGGLVWSLDKDFERMERLNIVSLYAPALPH